MSWSFKVGIVITFFILGVVLGINVAEKNMQKMRGVEGAPRAIQVTPVNGKVEIAVLGEVLQTTNPIKQVESKPKKVDTIRQVSTEKQSWLSQIGDGISSGLKVTTRFIMDVFLGSILN
ncbi:DUF3679 domain-containing protein [Thermoflavimicrobium daqui]|jgi:hypothetical protein|uniref:DUF3679 domain-containing protein n=1 Tax=Thermoflavimicrobium daqui TaxID=2137476 RepID=A0A364K6A5_9BACL|nr:DUF3679 domain-containing protein [Thermoflavimicrobium daqui]RAL25839.1 hypothetical protein DL897_07115 [Thermoflavimicrobium daqui]